MGTRSSFEQADPFAVTLAVLEMEANQAPEGGGGAVYWDEIAPANLESYRNRSRNSALYGSFTATPARALSTNARSVAMKGGRNMEELLDVELGVAGALVDEDEEEQDISREDCFARDPLRQERNGVVVASTPTEDVFADCQEVVPVRAGRFIFLDFVFVCLDPGSKITNTQFFAGRMIKEAHCSFKNIVELLFAPCEVIF